MVPKKKYLMDDASHQLSHWKKVTTRVGLKEEYPTLKLKKHVIPPGTIKYDIQLTI